MKWRKVASGSFESIEYETRKSGSEFLHIVTPRGLLDQDERAQVYVETLAHNKSENYFCILDNRKGTENLLSTAEMSEIGDFLVGKGIKRFFYAVVTGDPAYGNMIKLIKAVALTKNLEMEAISTLEFEDAEAFIVAHMKEFVEDY